LARNGLHKAGSQLTRRLPTEGKAYPVGIRPDHRRKIKVITR
jgi:hypothetical protein